MAKAADFTPIATVRKNNSEELRIRRTEHGGKPFVDLRVFQEIRGGARVHTGRGFVIHVEAIPALIDALQRAAKTVEGAA